MTKDDYEVLGLEGKPSKFGNNKFGEYTIDNETWINTDRVRDGENKLTICSKLDL